MKNTKKFKVVFMGTPDFAVPPLLSLIEAGYEIPFVVTMPDRPRGRGKKVLPPPVKSQAALHNIDSVQPAGKEDLPALIDKLNQVKPDIIVVAAYGMILPLEILELPLFACINIHASILPRHRGASPIQSAVLAGDSETGVTLMHMSEGMDEGDIISIARTPVGDKTAGELFDELSVMGAELLIETLPEIFAGKTVRKPQDNSLATYSGKIRKSDSVIDFNKPAEEIIRHIKAMSPWPGPRTIYDEKPMIVTKASISTNKDGKEADKNFSPGQILDVDNQGIEVATGHGLLLIEEIKPAGKQAMKVSEYIRGNKIDIGKILG